MELKEIGRNFNPIDIQHDTEALCSPQIKDAYTFYNAAIEKIRGDRIKEARVDLRKATQLKPDFDDAYVLLGLCIFSSGNRIDAMRTFNQINDLEKHNDAMYYFDMMSTASKDVVTGYKKEQTYKEPVSDADSRRRTVEREIMEKREVSARKEAEVKRTESLGRPEPAKPKKPEKEKSAPTTKQEESVASVQKRIRVPAPTPKKFEPVIQEDSFEEFDTFEDFGMMQSMESDVAGQGLTADNTPPAEAHGDFDNYFKPLDEGSISSYFSELHNEPLKEERPVQRTAPRNNSNTVVLRDKVPSKSRPKTAATSAKRPSTDINKSSNTQASAARKPGAVASAQKPQNSSANKPKTASAGNNGVSLDFKRIAIIACCAVVILVIALIVIFTNSDTLFGSGNALGDKDSGKHQLTASPTADLSDNTSETPSATKEPTAVPTEEPTAAPTEVPVALLQSEAEKKFEEAKALMSKRSFYECYLMISEGDWTYLQDSGKKSELDKLKTNSYNQFCNDYFNQMYKNVGLEDWEKVIEYGLVLIKYAPDYDRGGAVYFHVGKAYEFTGDKEKAIENYNITIEKYSDTQYATWARSRLSIVTKN